MSNDRLDGWKEISSYLGRDIRTCQRWENELDLPIYRVDESSSRSKVFSYKSEIDVWFRNHLENQEVGKKIFRKEKWIGLGFIFLALVIIFFFIYALFLKKTVRIQSPERPIQNPARWDLKGNYLTFYDMGDHLLWAAQVDNSIFRKDFYFDTDTRKEMRLFVKRWNRNKVDFSDVDKDGMNEVVSYLDHKEARERCITFFDNDGRKLWSKSIQFDQDYEGGKIVNDYRVIDLKFEDINHDGEEEILALWLHSRRFPSLFIIYDQRGTELLRYSHTGRLFFIRVIPDEEDQKKIYLPGTNNLLDGDAVLAVLDCSQLKSGLAPPYRIPSDLADKKEELKIYVPKNPKHAYQEYYLRFRHNAFSRLLTSKWIYVSEIHAGKNEINVQLFLGVPPICNLYFSFDAAFHLRYVRPGADLERMYQRLYKEGEILIPLERFLQQCRNDVFFWDGKGWTKEPTPRKTSPPWTNLYQNLL